MPKFLPVLFTFLCFYQHTAAQTCTATIVPDGPTTFCSGGNVRLSATAKRLKRANFGGVARAFASAFSIGSKAYVGTGYSGSFENDLWEYDAVNDVWSQKADFAGASRGYAAAFSIGTKGYLGTGNSSSGYLKDFWEYDPAANNWVQKADFGGSGRINATAFSIGNKGYLGTGLDANSTYTKDFWEYDPANNTWVQKADFGGDGRYAAAAMVIGTKGYVGTGVSDIMGNTKDFWEYDPAVNSWTQKADFGGAERFAATGFTLGGNGYIGTGYAMSYMSDFWKYDNSTDTWTRCEDFGGAPREYAMAFSTGTKAYVGTGIDQLGYVKDFWEYQPTLYHYSWSNGDTTGSITVTNPGTYTVTVTDPNGCSAKDSVIIANRNAPSSSEETITRCGSYTWNGTVYTQSGDYTYATINTGGCDSVVTLHLFISSADTLRQTVNTCKGFTWNGYTYRKSGTYYNRTVTVNCKLVAVLNLTIPRIASTVSTTDPLCHNSLSGTITVIANSGAAPYMYKNGLSGTYQSSGTFSGLFGNVYRIYFQDANGCEGYTDSVILNNPVPVSASFTTTSPTCFNTATASVTVTAAGGSSPYMYKNGAGGAYQSSNTITGLRAGVQYRMYVQDANGCIGSTSLINIAQTTPVTASFTAADATCANTANGSATVFASGGTAPYMYKNGLNGVYQTSNVIGGIRAGVKYRLYVQDANGCMGNTTLLTVNGPAPLTSVTTTTPPVCIGSPTGSATIQPTSGVAPFLYKYSYAGTYQSSNTFTGLSGNTSFRLYFIDSTGCVGVGDQVTLAEPPNPCNGITRMSGTFEGKNNPFETGKSLQISLSPNPASNQFTLIAHSIDKAKPVTIRVTDMNGRNIHLDKGQIEQSFRFGSAFAPGIYLVEVTQGNVVETVKAIKIK